MDYFNQYFGQDELAALRLRALFEGYGFRRVRVGKFEEYALYVENKNFLDTESVITFMDLDGRLLALKPDVTLSIVKNMPGDVAGTAQKLYYIDEVYRLSRENREYKVHSQIGVELIGENDGFANLEIIQLALDSLSAISNRSLLDISHMGFVSGLLDELGLSHRDEQTVLNCIHAKNISDLAIFLEQRGTPEEHRQRILALTAIHGSFSEELERAKSLVCSPGMEEAYTQLVEVAGILGDGSPAVNLDFSVINDLDYYNGLIFRGYIEGIPKLVLTGGRYDHMMRRLGKKSGAIGFAISLDELGTYLKTGRQFDFDVLITYPEHCNASALLACRRAMSQQGKSVRLEREYNDFMAAGFTYREHLYFQDGRLVPVDKEEKSC